MEKRFKNGLCLGKFMPIHNGHVHMIREAAKQCETVHVMVCSRLCEPINGYLRFYWAREIFKDDDGINVILCEDENPQYPEDDENFWQIWHDSVYSYIDDLDAVFASEDYVIPFAECLKVEPILVDRTRKAFPVSGTDIRRRPQNHWIFIPDVVKDYFRCNVAIVGPESTGKTTITKSLAKHFDGELIEEYGREYTDSKPAKELMKEDYLTIMGQQYSNFKKSRIGSTKMFTFSDTEAIVTRTFATMYCVETDSDFNGEMSAMMSKQVKEFDFYILCYPDIEWADDGTRDFKEQESRLDHFLMIKDYLEHFNTKYIILSGKGNQRTENAIKIVNEMKSINWEHDWAKISFEK